MLLLAPALAATPARLELHAVTADPRVGGPVEVELTVHDRSLTSWCPEPLAVSAVHEDGHVAPDPASWRPDRAPFRGYTQPVPLADGVGSVRFDLAEHAWLDAPGWWTVRVWGPDVEPATMTLALGPGTIPDLTPTDRLDQLLWPSRATSAALLASLEDPTDRQRAQVLEHLPTRLEDPWLRERAWSAELDASAVGVARELAGARTWTSQEGSFVVRVLGPLGDASDVGLLVPHLREGSDWGLAEAILRLVGPLGAPEEALRSLRLGSVSLSARLDRLEARVTPEADLDAMMDHLAYGACASVEGAGRVAPEELDRLVATWRAALAGDPAGLDEGGWFFDPGHDAALLPDGWVCVPHVREAPPLEPVPAAPYEAPGEPVGDDEVVWGASLDHLFAELDGRILGPFPFQWHDAGSTLLSVTISPVRGTAHRVITHALKEPPRGCAEPFVGFVTLSGVAWNWRPPEELWVQVVVTLRTADGWLDHRWTQWLQLEGSGHRLNVRWTDHRPRALGGGVPVRRLVHEGLLNRLTEVSAAVEVVGGRVLDVHVGAAGRTFTTVWQGTLGRIPMELDRR